MKNLLLGLMPLKFETKSHGDIPIGFFNIDSDMILIKNYFIFADDFCNLIKTWAENPDNEVNETIEIYVIENKSDIGNLMGAITGKEFSGFIGEVYKVFPFPKRKEDFKQQPESYRNRTAVEEIILNFGDKRNISIQTSKDDWTITIGDFVFTKDQFHDVVAYIWRGGMPEWRDGVRPKYVKDMMKTIINSRHWLFKAEAPKK